MVLLPFADRRSVECWPDDVVMLLKMSKATMMVSDRWCVCQLCIRGEDFAETYGHESWRVEKL